MNRKRCKTHKGISFDKKKKLWSARIAFHGVRYSLGRYKSKEKAEEVYRTALELGAIKVKAWCNTAIEYRGQLGYYAPGTTNLAEEEAIIKGFSSILDGDKEDDELIW